MKLLLLCLLLSVASAEEDLNAFINANNLFTPVVYKEIAKTEDGNFLVSPFSAEAILALAQSGGKDETAEEIRNALHLPDDNSKVDTAVKDFLRIVAKNEYVLNTANKIYIKEDFSINEEFRQKAAEVYKTEIENVNFGRRRKAAKTINEWVKEKTHNKIQNLIDFKTLNTHTRAVLINALYFKGNWSITFPPMLTRKADFYKTVHESVKVDMMYLEEEDLFYYECDHLKAKLLELPFKGESASITIILPERESLASLERNIEAVFKPHNLTSTRLVNVALPKFKIESHLDLKAVLKNLGVVKVFDEDKADLSGIAGEKGDLLISAAVQKTFIDVNEQGVEAAATTYIPVIVPSMGIDNPKSFIADHPFIFYIKVKGMILFAGRVLLPSL